MSDQNVSKAHGKPAKPSHPEVEPEALIEEGIKGSAAAKGEHHGRVKSPEGRHERSEE